ncbi:L10-interacting MYB domain-containing protein-like [Ananas comosus]|uniref:L10-interacting MYB domain-containing protein-like n=1 Tax=Ananas comosus TaxID=4615 RepID=A0A6P5GE46_ANACO|nr:L10-interacting MYB domain-containing protein-like [Ananas comosus]
MNSSQGEPSTQKEKKIKATWDATLLKIFCEICVKEVNAGNRPNTHLNRIGWQNVVNKFREKANRAYDKIQLKNKWDSLRRDWVIWMQLVGKETGLGWNHARGTIDASLEWWEEKLKVLPEAAKFRDTGLENAALLQDLGDTAWTLALGTMPPDPFRSRDLEEGSGDSSDDINVAAINLEPEIVEKKKIKKDRIGSAAYMQQQLSRICDAVESFNSQSSRSVTSGSSTYSFKDCMDLLMTMNEITRMSALYMFAIRLFKKSINREVFIDLKEPEVRLAWLNDEFEEYTATKKPAT